MKHPHTRGILLRIEGSGVWLDCELLPADPGTLHWRGRRAWRWTKHQDTSVLAVLGPADGSTITDEVERWCPVSRLIEAGPMTSAAIEAVRRIPPHRN